MFKSNSGFKTKNGYTSRLGFESHSGDVPPPFDDSLFNRPFSTGSLDDIKSGLDVNYRDGIGNNPIFDSNGWRLQQSTTARGFAPVSTSQVDEGCFLGDFTDATWDNGIRTSNRNMSFFSFNPVGKGKYTTEVVSDWVGAILTSNNGLVVEVDDVTNNNNFVYIIINNPTGLSDADAAQQGFEYPNTFTIDFSGSTLPLADTKQLRLDVGDTPNKPNFVPAIDEGCFLGDFTTSTFDGGVSTSNNNMTMFSTSASGKYASEITSNWVSAVLTASNGLIIEVSSVSSNSTFTYAIVNNPTGLSDDDAAIQGFSYPNRFEADFTSSTLTAAEILQLRYDVGDGWVDFPTNDFQREIEFTVNTSNNSVNLLSVRFADVNNLEGVAASILNGSLKVIAFSTVASIEQAFVVIIPGYNAGELVTAVASRRSSGISELTVEYNGLTLTDSDAFNDPTVQSISCVYGSSEVPVTDPYDFTLISEKVTAL
jgi:hypothetical protein